MAQLEPIVNGILHYSFFTSMAIYSRVNWDHYVLIFLGKYVETCSMKEVIKEKSLPDLVAKDFSGSWLDCD